MTLRPATIAEIIERVKLLRSDPHLSPKGLHVTLKARKSAKVSQEAT